MAVLGLAVVGADVGLLVASTGAGELEAGAIAELGAAVSFSAELESWSDVGAAVCKVYLFGFERFFRFEWGGVGLAVVGSDVVLLVASTGAGEMEAGVVAELGAAVSFSVGLRLSDVGAAVYNLYLLGFERFFRCECGGVGLPQGDDSSLGDFDPSSRTIRNGILSSQPSWSHFFLQVQTLRWVQTFLHFLGAFL